MIAQANANHERYKVQRAEIIAEAKSKPCMDCGNTFPIYVMDFDHVRGKKEFDIATCRSRRFGIQRLLDEIAKCDVVCANCHRIRTFSRLRASQTGKASDFGSEESRFES